VWPMSSAARSAGTCGRAPGPRPGTGGAAPWIVAPGIGMGGGGFPPAECGAKGIGSGTDRPVSELGGAPAKPMVSGRLTTKVVWHFGQRMVMPLRGTLRSSTWKVLSHPVHWTSNIDPRLGPWGRAGRQVHTRFLPDCLAR
jgi:hypothetical protein